MKQSNFDLHFLQTDNFCPSNRTSIGHGLPSVFQSQNVYARQCVGASVGLCTRHNLCRTDHIEIYGLRTDCLQLGITDKNYS